MVVIAMQTASLSVVAACGHGVGAEHTGRCNVDGNVDRQPRVNEGSVTSSVVDEKRLTQAHAHTYMYINYYYYYYYYYNCFMTLCPGLPG